MWGKFGDRARLDRQPTGTHPSTQEENHPGPNPAWSVLPRPNLGPPIIKTILILSKHFFLISLYISLSLSFPICSPLPYSFQNLFLLPSLFARVWLSATSPSQTCGLMQIQFRYDVYASCRTLPSTVVFVWSIMSQTQSVAICATCSSASATSKEPHMLKMMQALAFGQEIQWFWPFGP